LELPANTVFLAGDWSYWSKGLGDGGSVAYNGLAGSA